MVVLGKVTGYAMRGTRVELRFQDKAGCAHRVTWDVDTAPVRRVVRATTGCHTIAGLGAGVRVPALTPAGGSLVAFDGRRRAVVGSTTITLFSGTRRVGVIPRTGQGPALKAVLRGSHLVVLVPGSNLPERPDRLEVYDTSGHRSLGSWPLVEPAATLDLAGDTALFSTKNRNGLYALRLDDGATRFVAPGWTGDTPQIEPAGVVYEDGSFERDRAARRVPVKFVPTSALRQEFAETHKTLHANGPVTALAMNGPNLAVTFRGASRECDQVRIWQVFWQDVAKPTMDRGPGCVGADRIQGVAEIGIIAQWIIRIGSIQRLVWSSSENCVQHLVAQTSNTSGDQLLAVAADTGSHAYVIGHAGGGATLALSSAENHWATTRIQLEQAPRAIVADRDQVAILGSDGKISVKSADGAETASIVDGGGAQAIALRGNLLAVASGRNVDLYNVTNGERIDSWKFPARVSSISMRYGLVVATVGHDVIGLRLADGERVRFAHTAGSPLAVIDSAGIAFASTAHRHGLVTFVPMPDVERAFSAH
jgi:hypothetical protein